MRNDKSEDAQNVQAETTHTGKKPKGVSRSKSLALALTVGLAVALWLLRQQRLELYSGKARTALSRRQQRLEREGRQRLQGGAPAQHLELRQLVVVCSAS